MGGSRGFHGIKYGRGQTSSTTTCSIFTTRRAQLYQSWNEEGFSSLYKALIICEWLIHLTQGPYKWRVWQIFKTKNDRENCKRVYEGQKKGPYLGGKIKGQEDIFKATTNLIVRWVLQNHPKTQMNNTYTFTLSHIYRVIVLQYLRHL